MRILVRHEIRLQFAPGTARSVQQVLLTPRNSRTQAISAWSVKLPGMDTAGRFEDAYGNIAHLVNQAGFEGDLVISVEGSAETEDHHGVLGRVPAEPVPAIFRRQTKLTEADEALCAPFIEDAKVLSRRIAVLHGLMDTIAAPQHGPDAEALPQSQMQADGQGQSQMQGATAAVTLTPDPSALAHRFIGAARRLDIPARYVSGFYLPEDGEAALHAWAEAFDAALGWIGFDSLLGVCPTERHLRVATGLDETSAMPVRSVPPAASFVGLGLAVQRPAE